MRTLASSAMALAVLVGASSAGASGFDTTLAELRASGLAIRVVEGDWGRASPEDIQAVLYSAAAELWAHVADRKPLAIVVVPAPDHPRVLYKRPPQGEYVVELSARDRRWAQYAYQFGHELCHLLTDFDHRVAEDGTPLTRHQWFEESLCETASLFTLRRMAVTWQSAPPFAHWKSYAPWLREYADHMLAATHRRGAAELRVAAWFAANNAALARDPYARERYERYATALLPELEADPAQWNALRYLNREGSAAAATFREHLESWQRNAPTKHRRWIGELLAGFGFNAQRERELALAHDASAPTR